MSEPNVEPTEVPDDEINQPIEPSDTEQTEGEPA